MRAIDFKNVSERYRIKFIEQGKVSWEEIQALDNLTFGVEQGEIVGIIGENGAGKTTLLKLICRMLIPDSGKIEVHGRVSVIMELGAGFNPEFTGRENILLNAKMYGLSDNDLEEGIKNIIEFANLVRFIDAPVKYYSQGMYMRLAFALAVFVNPDVLLIDDIISVGDEEARQKCVKKIFELKHSGKTVILVSHEMDMVSKLCDRVILLEKGSIIEQGNPQQVTQYYLETVGDEKAIAILKKNDLKAVFNSGKLFVSYKGRLLTKQGGICSTFFAPAINSWVSSANLCWQVKETSSHKIVAEGETADKAFSQIWELQLLDEGLRWQIKTGGDGIKEPHIDLQLMPQYKKWITLDKEGDFPPFLYKTNWHNLGLDRFPEGVLAVSGEQDYPNMVLELNGQNQFRVFNSGYEQESRVIQAYFDKNGSACVDINLFPQGDKFKHYIANLKDKMALKKQDLEIVGDEKAIAILKKSDLKAVFNNGKLFIYYNGRLLTNREGAHSVFFIPAINSWVSSANLCWQVKESSSHKIVAEGETADKAFSQIWELQLLDEGLRWQIKTEGAGAKESHIDLQLIPQYRRWMTLDKEGDFPPFMYKTNWHDLGLDKFPEGVFAVSGGQDYPDIILERPEAGQFRVFNSGYDQESRIIQAYFDEKSFTCVDISLFRRKDKFDEHLVKLKHNMFLKKQQKEIGLLSCRTIASGDMRLFVDVDNKQIRLYYKDKEITTGNSLHCAFNISKQWFHSKDALWVIQKKSENKIILTQTYELLNLLHIWELVFLPNNVLEIKVAMIAKKPILLTNQDFRLELKGGYRSWSTPFEEADLEINQYVNNIAPVRLKESKVSEIIFETGKSMFLPKVFFEITHNADKQSLSIYKYKEGAQEAICLNSTRIVSAKDRSILPGESNYFSGKIILGKDIKVKEKSVFTKNIQLSKDKLQFSFDQGRGRIFWQGEELTTGLCAFTSIRSQGIWHDSYQANWDIVSQNQTKMSFIGHWPHVPISQIWEIELTEEKLISWKIGMEVLEEVNLELEQTNIMLSEKFVFWKTSNENRGRFLNEYTKDYDILPFRFWYGNTPSGGIITYGNNAAVTFKCIGDPGVFKAIVENTDYLYRARLVQYQKSNSATLKPGRYTYFEGAIKVERKNLLPKA